ncbi:hypothetical protein [Streptomyces sp. NPDC004658]|uniref:hypothetical protein n=1 Tax=Streptomyces sp. NPDC004658 TaxID=3154672 RepID=UPI0033A9C4F6
MSHKGRPRRDNADKKGPIARLTRQLQELRPAGLTLKQLSTTTGLSVSALSKITDPDQCPPWNSLTAYLVALGEDPNDWRPQWEMCADVHQRRHAGVPELPEQRAAYQRLLPRHVVNLEQFGMGLSELRLWQGDPYYKTIIKRALAKGGSVSKTTLSEAFNGKILPTETALEGILLGLGLHPDDDEYRDWFEARRVLQAGIRREKMEAKALQNANRRRVIRRRFNRSALRRPD